YQGDVAPRGRHGGELLDNLLCRLIASTPGRRITIDTRTPRITMVRLLLTTATVALLAGAAPAQDKDIFFTVPDSTKLSMHDMVVREAMVKEAADAPITMDGLQTSLNFVVDFHVFKLADAKTSQEFRDKPKIMSNAVDTTEALIRFVF